ncbi:MAG: phage virion morphogenesis protein [Bergeyella sp.]
MTKIDSKFQLPDFRKLSEGVMKDLPKKVSEEACNFFMASFIKEGFTDTSFIPWVKRKDDFTHKLLQQSLALKASIKIETATLDKIEISAGNGLKYAAIHNEGGTITIKITPKMRKYFWYMFKKTEDEKWKWMALSKKDVMTVKIPKRQFIGNSETLNQKLDKIFIDTIYKYFKNLK